jgi:hypothetical protein
MAGGSRFRTVTWGDLSLSLLEAKRVGSINHKIAHFLHSPERLAKLLAMMDLKDAQENII